MEDVFPVKGLLWRRPIVLAAIIGALTPLGAFAHIGDQYNSIHFHSGRVDFGTIPRRGILWYERDDRAVKQAELGATEPRIRVELQRRYVFDPSSGSMPYVQQSEKQLRKLLTLADLYARAGNWRALSRTYVALSKSIGWTAELRDRMEVLSQLSSVKGRARTTLIPILRVYLAGMKLYEGQLRKGGKGIGLTEAQGVFQRVYQSRSAGFLRSHALYQLASLEYGWGIFLVPLRCTSNCGTNSHSVQNTRRALL